VSHNEETDAQWPQVAAWDDDRLGTTAGSI
jgi:hypothetical protein